MWTQQKFILGGIFSVIGVIIQTGLSFTATQVFGTASSTPVLFFMWPLLMVLFRGIINENGAISLMGFVGGLLTVPTPAYGPPGFVPKFIPIMAGSMTMDVVFAILRGRPNIASVVSGGLAVAVAVPLFAEVFLFFGIPGSETIRSLAMFLMVLGAVEAAFGGFVGQKLYERVKERPSIRRMYG